MMNFMNFDLARALTEQRRNQAMRSRERRRLIEETRAAKTDATAPREAEIIELVFGSHCETDQIGA